MLDRFLVFTAKTEIHASYIVKVGITGMCELRDFPILPLVLPTCREGKAISAPCLLIIAASKHFSVNVSHDLTTTIAL